MYGLRQRARYAPFRCMRLPSVNVVHPRPALRGYSLRGFRSLSNIAEFAARSAAG